MKKVLVAAAGLMLVGTMASTAMADVGFSGDARARYYNQSDYDTLGGADSNDFFNSRVRLQWKATTKGGAYAIGRFRLADAKWDGTANTKDFGSGGNLFVDKAYIGVPFGPITVEAGLMYRSITPFFLLDVNVDAVQFKYSSDNTDLIAFYDIQAEEDVSGSDADDYGLVLIQKFSGGWGLTAGAVYSDADGGAEGFMGTVMVEGNLSSVAVAGEISYKEEDLTANADDGIGGWISATVPMGAVSLTGRAGFANDGFVVDTDFDAGMIIYSGYSQIGSNALGSDGDTAFFSLAASFKASEKLTLGASVGYADTDDLDGVFDIGATAAYAVTDGATLKALVGFADVDNSVGADDDNPFGFGLSLEISY